MLNTHSRGSTTQPIWLDGILCSTTYSCIRSCQRCPGREIQICRHSEDVTIECGKLTNDWPIMWCVYNSWNAPWLLLLFVLAITLRKLALYIMQNIAASVSIHNWWDEQGRCIYCNTEIPHFLKTISLCQSVIVRIYFIITLFSVCTEGLCNWSNLHV